MKRSEMAETELVPIPENAEEAAARERLLRHRIAVRKSRMKKKFVKKILPSLEFEVFTVNGHTYFVQKELIQM